MTMQRMLCDVTDDLLREVRNFLDITWEDKDGDEKLKGMIAAGMNWINEKAGTQLDYSGWEPQKMLLINYVMYARSGALDDFNRNYLGEVMTLQAKEAANRAKEAAGNL